MSLATDNTTLAMHKSANAALYSGIGVAFTGQRIESHHVRGAGGE